MLGSTHIGPMLLAYLPKQKILVNADMYTPPAPGAQIPSQAMQGIQALKSNIDRLKLDVAQHVTLHGIAGAARGFPEAGVDGEAGDELEKVGGSLGFEPSGPRPAWPTRWVPGARRSMRPGPGVLFPRRIHRRSDQERRIGALARTEFLEPSAPNLGDVPVALLIDARAVHVEERAGKVAQHAPGVEQPSVEIPLRNLGRRVGEAPDARAIGRNDQELQVGLRPDRPLIDDLAAVAVEHLDSPIRAIADVRAASSDRPRCRARC